MASILSWPQSVNGAFNEPNSFGISGLICQAKATEFGMHVGLDMLINIGSEFYHNCKKNWDIL